MSLSRPQSRASSGGRGPPPTPPPTYLWEEVRRQRHRGGYPWTILDKEPLENSVDVELLLKGEISGAALNASLPDEYCTETLQRRRISRRDRFNQGRARSEPTPSIPSSSSRTDMASIPPEEEEVEVDDFPLNDEEIPDFVMEYLQSDEGNMEDNIPDHILEYIQSRAAALQQRQEPEDDIVYTEEELRIIEDTRRKMVESGELPKAAMDVESAEAEPEVEPEPREEDEDFDVFFQQALDTHNTAKALEVHPVEETAPPSTEEKGAKPKKGGKFKLRSISLPPKPQINLRFPKSLKLTKDAPAEVKEEAADKKKEKKEKKEKRKQSPSPIRQRINEQFQSWNNSLKKFKPLARKSKREDDVKGFIALLPGVSNKKSNEQEHQYEEVQPPPVKDFPDADEVLDLRERFPEQPAPAAAAPVVTITAPDDMEEPLEREDSLDKAGEVTNPEETMEDVDNLPESEIADIEDNQVVPDQTDSVKQIEEILEIPDIDEAGILEIDEAHFIDEEQIEEVEEEQVSEPQVQDPEEVAETGEIPEPEEVLESEEVPQPEEVPEPKSKASAFAARGLKALEATKSTIQRKLSRENLQATRNKLQATFTGTLKKRSKNKDKSSTLPRASEQQNIFDSSTTPRGKSKDFETSTPIEITAPRRNRFKKKTDTVEYPTATRRKHKKTPRIETVSSVEVQNLENEVENPVHEEGSDKENIIRPNPRRNKNRRPEKRYGFHEDFIRPQSAYYSSEIRNSWNDFPHLSQDIQEAFCAPVNSLEAVDGSTGELPVKRPQRPLRSRKKNRFSTLSEADIDYHDYCNVPNPIPRRLKKTQHSTDRFTTWPKRIDQPAAPKRLKRVKTASRDNFQTWPRKCEAPVAPRRSRSKTGSTFLNQEESLNDFNVNQAHYDVPNSQPVYNILQTEVPETVLKFDEQEIAPETPDIAFADENEEVQEEPIPEEVEIVVPKAPMRKIKSRTNSLRREKNNERKFDDATWPRVKKTENLERVPVVPGRNRRQSKFLEQPTEGTAAPSVTPNEYEPKISNDEALQELDQLLETLATTQHQAAPVAEIPASVEDPYAEIKSLRKSPPPRPPPPVYAAQSTASYSYIYTVPRRNPRTYHEISPERNLRDYCTIRPHRPPRRSRPRTELYDDTASRQQPETGRRHSISSAGEVKQPENKDVSEHLDGDLHTDELRERKLQDSSVIEKMRARPLPAPPRTKRIRSHSPPQKPPRRESSLRRKGSLRAAGSRQEKPATSPVHIDGYEPVCPEPIPCEPARVEEVSIAIQTDPLPEYDDDLMEASLADVVPDHDPDHAKVINNYQMDTQEEAAPELEIQQQIAEPEEEREEESIIPEEFTRLKSPEDPQTQDVKRPSKDPANDSEVTQEQSALTSPIPEEQLTVTKEDHKHDTKAERVKDSCKDPKATARDSAEKQRESGTTSEIPEEFKKLKAPADPQDSRKPAEPKSPRDPVNSRETDEEDSFSRIPPNFPLPLPQLRVEFPSRLQLAELEVERLNVRDLQAQRIVVSNIDTQSLQVSEITSSSGPVLLTSAAVLSAAPAPVPASVEPAQQPQESRKPDEKTQRKEEEKPVDRPKEEEKPAVETSDASQQCNFTSSAAGTTQTEPEKELPRDVSIAGRMPVAGTVPEAAPTQVEEREPTVGELALQLVGVSTRQLGRAAGVAVQRTWQLAQQVARLGWQRIDEQLRARGIHLSKQEQENVQVIVILIMIIIAGIMLLGMGRRGLGHRWEIYYPY